MRSRQQAVLSDPGLSALLQQALALASGDGCRQEVARLLTSACERVRAFDDESSASDQAVLEERQRLARDLHDSVTQSLYGITLYAEAASRTLAAGDLVTVSSQLHELQSTALEALQEMRLLIYELRPPVLEQEGLVAALRARLEAVEGRSRMATELGVSGEIAIPPVVEQALYRIAQETLNNILKHACASHVAVRLAQQPGQISLEVADDGRGFDPAAAQDHGGMGLRGIAERVQQLRGRLVILSAPHGGTRVLVEVPL